jgi:hypothetical protein
MSTSPKKFAGQFAWEKILYRTNEHLASFIISHLGSMVLWIAGVSVVVFVLVLVDQIIIAIVFAVLVMGYYVWHMIHMRASNFFMITSRRIIKSILTGISEPHTKEIRLESVKQMTSLHRTLAGKIFGYGSLYINPGSDAIRFRGMPLHTEVESYLARVVDYLKTNPPTDELSVFVPRKERYAVKEEAI